MRPQSHCIVRLVAIGPRCDRSAIFATISSSGRIPRSTYMRRRAITNDWRISMARAIVGNRATIGGSDHRPIVTAGDRCNDQQDRCIQRPIVRALVACCDRAYDKSWNQKTDGTIIRGLQRSIARSLVASCDRSYDQPLRPRTDRTINRDDKRFGIAG